MDPLEIMFFFISREGFKKQYLAKKSPYLHVCKCSTPATNCPPQHPQQKGGQHNNATATDGKQQSTNAADKQ
jgi:hypothetical protein